jgi:hypothetical protein
MVGWQSGWCCDCETRSSMVVLREPESCRCCSLKVPAVLKGDMSLQVRGLPAPSFATKTSQRLKVHLQLPYAVFWFKASPDTAMEKVDGSPNVLLLTYTLTVISNFDPAILILTPTKCHLSRVSICTCNEYLGIAFSSSSLHRTLRTLVSGTCQLATSQAVLRYYYYILIVESAGVPGH